MYQLDTDFVEMHIAIPYYGTELYEIAKYCDAVDNDGKFVGVSSGWGPTNNPHKEARFACNLYLQHWNQS